MTLFRAHRVALSWLWFDLWVGAYWDVDVAKLYVCLVPTIVLSIDCAVWVEA